MSKDMGKPISNLVETFKPQGLSRKGTMKNRTWRIIPFLMFGLLYGCATTENQQVPAEAQLSPLSGKPHSEFKILLSDDTDGKADGSAASLLETALDAEVCDDAGDPPAQEMSAETEAQKLASFETTLNRALSFCDVAQEAWEAKKTEAALEALDKAYALILSEDDVGCANLVKRKEEVRFQISKRIFEIYAARNSVAKGHHDAIPIDLNEHVRAEIESMTKGQHFYKAYQRSGAYRAAIVEELKKAGLPEELSWLPLIESGFRNRALSPARALGMWQFIPSTGYKFGLKRDRYIDERMDPEKATRAAIGYLKELHNMFGDWSTVLAAYNCGEGRVIREIRSQNINYLDNFWDLYEKLPRETARYVPRFLATLHIVNHPEKYGLDKIRLDAPLSFETVEVTKQAHLKDIAEKIGVSSDRMEELNPELRKKILPDRKYALKVPRGKSELLLASLNKITETKASQTVAEPSQKPAEHYVYHRVRRGDTLSTIASRYKTDMNGIMRANRIHRKHYLVAGKILKIPTRYAPATRSAKSAPAKTYHRGISTHVVKKGDSLWNIAKKYGTTTKDISRINRLRDNRLSIGQILKVPTGKGESFKTAHKSPKLKTYRVRNGDVPLEIAKRHNMPLERFLQVNRLSEKSTIYPGQKLYVE